MLNPNANEFTPGQFSIPAAPTPAPSQEEKQPQQSQHHAKRKPPKSNKPQQQQQQKQQKNQGKSDRRSSSDQHSQKKPSKPKSQQQQTSSSGGGIGRRHNKGSSSTQQKQQQSAAAAVSSLAVDNESFGLLTKFITIEEAIDPVFRARPTDEGNKSIDSSGGNSGGSIGAGGGTNESVGKLVHGYERYIEWITRCLRAFETITVVGMDYAIADVISLVTILQRRNIGEHEGNINKIITL